MGTVEDYLRESGYEAGAGAQYDLDGEVMPTGDGLPLLSSLPQFSEVTLQGIFVYNVLPLIILAVLITFSTPFIDKYLLGEEYEIDWSGRSGRFWKILTEGPN